MISYIQGQHTEDRIRILEVQKWDVALNIALYMYEMNQNRPPENGSVNFARYEHRRVFQHENSTEIWRPIR